jgi:endonuclease/exonuclease/phosphatase family metal-dependent hydrolase
MKIMTFNIARYDYNWNARKSRIIDAVLKEKPDIVFMQEVFDDQRHQDNDGPHQGEQLNEQLKYKNLIYDVVEQTITEHKQDVKKLVFDGLLCLTNLPVIEQRIVRLKKHESDRHYRAIQIIKVLYHGKEVLFYNTHYSNTNEWSKLHIEETRDYFTEKSELPIIVGDLNILNPEIIKEVLGNMLESSYDVKKYISFPSKNEVLDYILIPKKQKFIDVRCDYDNCSDHRPLIAEIKLVQD